MTVTTEHIIFDWGDTVMKDDPTRTNAMHLWPSVSLVDGADVVLPMLAKSHRLSIATSALSTEAMVRLALARVGVAGCFTSVFSSETLGAKKTEAQFWSSILKALGAGPEDVTVIGDGFENDVIGPAALGIRALWLNMCTNEDRTGPTFGTIHRLTELRPRSG